MPIWLGHGYFAICVGTGVGTYYRRLCVARHGKTRGGAGNDVLVRSAGRDLMIVEVGADQVVSKAATIG
jgi:hypothetical protein